VTACTFSGNMGNRGFAGTTSQGRGIDGIGTGGLSASGGTSLIGNTISAGNTGSNGGGRDVSGPFNSSGYNLIGSGNQGTGFSNGVNHDQVGTDAAPVNANLGALQNNGGPTDTMALLSGSPAINAGDPTTPSRDQRYYLRNGAPDIGAFEFSGVLAPISAVSRKTHGSVGMFDINLPLTAPIGIECRTGSSHQVIMTFATPVTVGSATAIPDPKPMSPPATGSVSSFSVNGAQLTVNLTGVSNAQTLTLNMSSVSDGVNTNSAFAFLIGILIGDSTGDGSVNSADISQTKSKSGQAVGSSNFRNDVTVDGSLNSADISLVKSKSGTALP
jgi:hypothetical protein